MAVSDRHHIMSNDQKVSKHGIVFFSCFIIFLFVVTAAGVVPCGIPKKKPRTSSIVQFIFYFWSFEISRKILRNQKTLSV